MMSEEKQIKELRVVLWGNPYVRMGSHQADMLAQYLHNECYRKQSEGEWIPHRFDKNGRPISWYCSNCRGIGDHSSYCSHCGAKMGGGAK